MNRGSRVPQATLTGVVFAAGVGTLATEIAASRLLAPYFGNSTIVWANVIGLTLASLSVGYWLGGRVADRHPTGRALGLVVVAASCLIALATLAARPILDLSVEGLDRVSAGAAIGSFFGVLILFVPPVTLLGMVAPFAIRLAIVGVETAGTVAGRLYAISTIGSLLGTFLAALVTIPVIGTQRTLLGAAAVIGATG
ncbi:MAG TPA: fused MFS/spermidine synthase, partial [Gaiellaceae bacterium]|nr:fused MFS/spermidine synthase [Gaiellaceae bacterium]